MMGFKNKVVVITGASSGIGKASAAEFAKLGSRLVLVARRKERLEQAQRDLSGCDTEILAIPCDVSSKEQVKSMSDQVLERFDRIDILINNAGFAIYGPVSELSVEDIESQMSTNYLGMVYCTKNFLPTFLRQNSGHIVNVASVAASFGLPGIASYCASKFAMLGFSEGLRHELHDTGVGVTVVSPIMVRTEFFDNPSFEKMPKYSHASLSPQTVARAVVRAASSNRLEIIVPPVVRGAVWLKHTLPFAINPLMGRSFRKQLEGSG